MLVFFYGKRFNVLVGIWGDSVDIQLGQFLDVWRKFEFFSLVQLSEI